MLARPLPWPDLLSASASSVVSQCPVIRDPYAITSAPFAVAPAEQSDGSLAPVVPPAVVPTNEVSSLIDKITRSLAPSTLVHVGAPCCTGALPEPETMLQARPSTRYLVPLIHRPSAAEVRLFRGSTVWRPDPSCA